MFTISNLRELYFNGTSFVTYLLFIILVIARSNFQCPSCSEVGENAENDCETNIEMKDCRQQSDPLCLLVIQYKDTSRKYRRFCASRNTYDQIKNNCKACVVGKCSTTGCKAEVTELPPPGK